jgi:tripartite ATP-independent transporter DctM subunit
MACAAFSAISGSNTATAATMSQVAIPAMRKYNYHPMLNAGSVAAGATLGVLIPPSIVLVVYGLYTGQSIGKLFFGNVIPSAILTILIALTVGYICWRHPDWGPAGTKSTWRERFKALPDIIDILILFAIIMYALFTGVVTATEAAAASCALGLIICLIRRKLSWKNFIASIVDTLRISCLVFMIVAGAVIFGRFLTVTRLPFEAADWISGLALPNWMLLWVVLICYIIGRFGLFARVVTYLLSHRHAHGLRSDLVWPGDHHRDDHGFHHAAHRHMLLRGCRDGQRHTAGHGLPGRALLHPSIYSVHHSTHAVAVLDGALSVEPREIARAMS